MYTIDLRTDDGGEEQRSEEESSEVVPFTAASIIDCALVGDMDTGLARWAIAWTPEMEPTVRDGHSKGGEKVAESVPSTAMSNAPSAVMSGTSTNERPASLWEKGFNAPRTSSALGEARERTVPRTEYPAFRKRKAVWAAM